MEVEVVRFNKVSIGSMESIIVKNFTNTEEANDYYTNWKCDESNNDNILVLGKQWNEKDKTEIEITDDCKYLYTYSVNLWDSECNDMVHSHNFEIYTK